MFGGDSMKRTEGMSKKVFLSAWWDSDSAPAHPENQRARALRTAHRQRANPKTAISRQQILTNTFSPSKKSIAEFFKFGSVKMLCQNSAIAAA
jgi:hypothetical protein